jgi:hypothetical protein
MSKAKAESTATENDNASAPEHEHVHWIWCRRPMGYSIPRKSALYRETGLAFNGDGTPMLDGTGKQARMREKIPMTYVSLSGGLCVISEADWEITGMGDEKLSPLAFYGDIVEVTPTALDPYTSRDLIRSTASSVALREWLARETREPVRAQIQARLDRMRAAHVPVDQRSKDEAKLAAQFESDRAEAQALIAARIANDTESYDLGVIP